MRTAFERAAGLGDVVRQAGELSARTMIFDVEPLVAYWDGGQEALDQGIARVLSEVAVLPALQVLCFATNSSRRPSVVPSRAGPCRWFTWRRRVSRCGPRRIGVSPGPGW